MNKLREMKFADWFAIAGFVLSILVFVAQEGLPRPNDPQQIAKYKFLIGAILLMAILFSLCRYIWILKRRITDYRDDYNLLNATMLRSTLVAEIRNQDGDLKADNEEHLRVFRNDIPIRRSRKHFFTSETKLGDFRPVAKIISSHPEIALRAVVLKDGKEEVVSGATNYRYEWFYEFRPPLKSKGAYVHYYYGYILPRSEAFAFSNHGSVFFFSQLINYIQKEVTLLPPAGYKIELGDCYIKDYEGERQELPAGAQPRLDADSKKLTWAPPYIKAATLFFHYKLVSE